MLRRSFLSAAAAGVALTRLAPSSAAAPARTLRLAYILSTDSQFGAGSTVFAKEVEQRTAGRYRIEQFPDATLGGEVETLKGVQLGTIDLALVTGVGLPSFLPEIGVFNIPFLFRSRSHAHAVLDGPIGRAYLDKFREKDVVALAWCESGLRHITNSKRPVRAPEDLKGLKLRLPQSEVMMTGFKALGAEVSVLPFPQLFGALQSGQFDGQENPIATIRSAKLHQVQKHLTLSGHIYDPAAIVMSIDVFEELSDEDRQAFLEAARLAAQASRDYAARAEAEGVAALAQAGMQVVSEIDRERFAAAMASSMPEYERRFGADAIGNIRQAS